MYENVLLDVQRQVLFKYFERGFVRIQPKWERWWNTMSHYNTNIAIGLCGKQNQSLIAIILLCLVSFWSLYFLASYPPFLVSHPLRLISFIVGRCRKSFNSILLARWNSWEILGWQLVLTDDEFILNPTRKKHLNGEYWSLDYYAKATAYRTS